MSFVSPFHWGGEGEYDENAEEALMEPEIAKAFIDLTLTDAPSPAGTRVQYEHRNAPLGRDEECLTYFVHFGHIIRSGIVLGMPRVKRIDSSIKIHYIRVQRIIRKIATDRIRIRGIPCAKSRMVKGMFSRTHTEHEICPVIEVEENDPRHPLEQGTIEIDWSAAMTVHEMVLTNHLYDTLSTPCRDVLICRWFCFLYWATSRDRSKSFKPAEYALVRATPELIGHATLRPEPETKTMCETGHTRKKYGFPAEDPVCEPEILRDMWRLHGTVRGGSFVPVSPASGCPTGHRLFGQKYTLFDAFSGAGGVSCGARAAGFHVEAAVDFWDQACKTYRLNFPDAEIYNLDIHGFIGAAHGRGHQTDVLHLSPPCQFWSPAHTIAGRQDDQNKAALFSCLELIRAVRPRIFTVEQTFGILHDAHIDCFQSLVSDFTDLGYSVRWRVVFLPAWGLPQRRKRLIMIGSCIGEPLPTFPKPTHSDNPHDGLPPYRSVSQAIGIIPRGTTHHHLQEIRPYAAPRVPYDPGTILTRCITTKGGENYHWDGMRDYTAREYALLQGFPLEYKFPPDLGITALKRQIGNAFAPSAVAVLYSHIERHLLAVDELEREGKLPRDFVVVDDNFVMLPHMASLATALACHGHGLRDKAASPTPGSCPHFAIPLDEPMDFAPKVASGGAGVRVRSEIVVARQGTVDDPIILGEAIGVRVGLGDGSPAGGVRMGTKFGIDPDFSDEDHAPILVKEEGNEGNPIVIEDDDDERAMYRPERFVVHGRRNLNRRRSRVLAREVLSTQNYRNPLPEGNSGPVFLGRMAYDMENC